MTTPYVVWTEPVGGVAVSTYGYYDASIAHDDAVECQAAQRWSARAYERFREGIMHEAEFWVFFSIYAPVGLVGLLGNALTIYIFAAKVKKTPTSSFIIALAIVDLCVCLVVIPTRFVSILFIDVGFDFVCRGGEFVFYFALPMSGFLLLAIAVDRFVLIWLARPDLVTPRTVKVVLVVILLVSVVVGLPSAFTVSVYQNLPRPWTNTTFSCNLGVCRQEFKHIGQGGAWVYWVAIAMLYIVMAVMLVVMYLMIFLRVMKARKKVAKWAVNKSAADAGRKTQVSEIAAESVTDSRCAVETREASAAITGNGLSGLKVSSHGNIQKEDDKQNPAAHLLAPRKSSFRISAGYAPSAADGDQPHRDSSSKRVRKKRLPHVNTAVTLCLVTGTFIAFYMPVMVITLFGICVEESSMSRATAKCETYNAVGIVWHLFLLNHVVNPIIYAFMNPRFREALCGMLLRRPTPAVSISSHG